MNDFHQISDDFLQGADRLPAGGRPNRDDRLLAPECEERDDHGRDAPSLLSSAGSYHPPNATPLSLDESGFAADRQESARQLPPMPGAAPIDVHTALLDPQPVPMGPCIMIASTEAIHERYKEEIQRLERRLDEERARFDKLLADMRAETAERTDFLLRAPPQRMAVYGLDGRRRAFGHIVKCWHGANCSYLRRGICRYGHHPEDCTAAETHGNAKNRTLRARRVTSPADRYQHVATRAASYDSTSRKAFVPTNGDTTIRRKAASKKRERVLQQGGVKPHSPHVDVRLASAVGMPRDVAVNSNFLHMIGRTKRSTRTMLNSDLSMPSLHSSTSESATLIVPATCHSNSALLGENRRSAKLDVDVLNQHFAKPKPTSGPAKTALHQSSTSFHITNVTHVAASMSTGAQPTEPNLSKKGLHAAAVAVRPPAAIAAREGRPNQSADACDHTVAVDPNEMFVLQFAMSEATSQVIINVNKQVTAVTEANNVHDVNEQDTTYVVDANATPAPTALAAATSEEKPSEAPVAAIDATTSAEREAEHSASTDVHVPTTLQPSDSGANKEAFGVNESSGEFLHEGPCHSSKGAQLVGAHRSLSTTVTIDEKLAQLSAMPIENTYLHLRYRRNLRRARLLRTWLNFV